MMRITVTTPPMIAVVVGIVILSPGVVVGTAEILYIHAIYILRLILCHAQYNIILKCMHSATTHDHSNYMRTPSGQCVIILLNAC